MVWIFNTDQRHYSGRIEPSSFSLQRMQRWEIAKSVEFLIVSITCVGQASRLCRGARAETVEDNGKKYVFLLGTLICFIFLASYQWCVFENIAHGTPMQGVQEPFPYVYPGSAVCQTQVFFFGKVGSFTCMAWDLVCKGLFKFPSTIFDHFSLYKIAEAPVMTSSCHDIATQLMTQAELVSWSVPVVNCQNILVRTHCAESQQHCPNTSLTLIWNIRLRSWTFWASWGAENGSITARLAVLSNKIMPFAQMRASEPLRMLCSAWSMCLMLFQFEIGRYRRPLYLFHLLYLQKGPIIFTPYPFGIFGSETDWIRTS